MIQRSPGYDDPFASICEAAGAIMLTFRESRITFVMHETVVP